MHLGGLEGNLPRQELSVLYFCLEPTTAGGWSSGPGNLRGLKCPRAPFMRCWASPGPGPHLTSRENALTIKAEDDIGTDVAIREESVADLWWGRRSLGPLSHENHPSTLPPPLSMGSSNGL